MNSTFGLTRRAVVLGLGGGVAAGCSTSPTLDLLGRSVAGHRSQVPTGRYPMSDEQLQKLPYATLGVTIGRNAPAVMVLATIDGDELRWVSADRVLFVTRKGRLVQTRGLKRDLIATDWSTDDPLLEAIQQAGDPDSSGTVTRFIDVGRPKAEHVGVASRFSTPVADTLAMLNGASESLRIEERVVVGDWRWAARNTFWVASGSNAVLKSRQQFCPEIPPIELEVLKPVRA